MYFTTEFLYCNSSPTYRGIHQLIIVVGDFLLTHVKDTSKLFLVIFTTSNIVGSYINTSLCSQTEMG